MPPRYNRITTLLVLLGICSTAHGHNWVNHPSRAAKVNTAKPCPPRQFLQQTHVQVNPGGSVPVEYATGHTWSTGSFVLVRAEDESQLLKYNDQVRDAYLEAASDVKLQKIIHVSAGPGGSGVGTLKSKQDGKNRCSPETASPAMRTFSKEITQEEAFNRPSVFRNIGGAKGMKYFEYNEAFPEACRGSNYTAYDNSDYPYIKAVMKYRVFNHMAKDGDIALFPIPQNLPTGKYILHWFWRGYYDCTDMNIVVESKPVSDMWGTPEGGDQMVRTDHCEFWDKSRECGEGDHCGSTEIGQKEGLQKKIVTTRPIAAAKKATAAKEKAAYDEADFAWQAKKKAKAVASELVAKAKVSTNTAKQRKNKSGSELKKARNQMPKMNNSLKKAKLQERYAISNETAAEKRVKTTTSEKWKVKAEANEGKQKTRVVLAQENLEAVQFKVDANRARITSTLSEDTDAREALSTANKDYTAKQKVLSTATAEEKSTRTKSVAALGKSNRAKQASVKATRDYEGSVYKQGYGASVPLCKVIPAGSNDVRPCSDACFAASVGGCGGFNVVPAVKPSQSLWEPRIPDQCKETLAGTQLAPGDRICYAVNEGRPTDGGPAYDLTDDPEDPVWYNTCYKRQPSAKVIFKGNTCGAPCDLNADEFKPQWRFGNKCIACTMAKQNYNSSKNFAPMWGVTDQCERCA